MDKTQLAINSLTATTCEVCGHPKGKRDAFCVGCYLSLPQAMKHSLNYAFSVLKSRSQYLPLWIKCYNFIKKDRLEVAQIMDDVEEM